MSNDYRSRIVSADEAVAAVQSGQRVAIHNGCAEPIELVKALTRRGTLLHDVEVMHLATMGVADHSLPEYEGHFRTNALVRRQLFLWVDDNYFSRSATTTTVSSVGQGRSPAAVRVCLKR